MSRATTESCSTHSTIGRGLLRLLRPVLAMLVLLIFVPAQALGQTFIRNEVTCPSCTIELIEQFHVGERDGQQLRSDIAPFAGIDALGRFWLPNFSQPGVIQVFSRDGEYEEFSFAGLPSVKLLECSDHGFLLLDSQRLHRLDPGDGHITPLATTRGLGRLAYPVSMLEIRDSVLWISGAPRHPEYLGSPMVELNLYSGQILSFAPSGLSHYDQMVELHSVRHLTRLSDNRIVAAHKYSYTIESLETLAQKPTITTRDAPWFRPQATAQIEQMITAVLPLEDELLAVVILVQDENWTNTALETAERRPRALQWNTMIEVLDLDSKSVLARRIFPEAIVGGVCPNGELMGFTSEDRRDERLVVSSIHFRR